MALAGGMVLAAILGMYHLGTRDIWYDEAFSVAIARLDGTAFLREITQGDPSQSFYYLLLHSWLPVAGDSAAAVRSLSVIFAVATVPALYLTAAELFDHRIAATSALLLPINAFFVEQAQEARGYSMVMFMVTVATYLYVRAVRTSSAQSWAAYAVIGGLAVFTHAFALLILVTHWLTSFLHDADGRRRTVRLLIGGLVIVIGVLIAVPIINLLDERWDWIDFQSGDELAYGVGALLGQQGWLLLPYLFLVCMGGALFVQSIIGRKGRDPVWRYSIPSAWFFLPVIVSLLASFITPMFVPRYLSVCVPGFVLLASLAIWECRPPFVMGLVVGALVITGAFNLHGWYTAPRDFKSRPWKTASEYLLTHAEEGDVVLFDGEAPAVILTYYRSILRTGPDDLVFPFLHPTVAYGTDSSTSPREALERFVEEDPRPPRVWVMTSFGWLPPELARSLAGYEPSPISTRMGGIGITLFTPTPSSDASVG